jgi:hypothetical protein
MTELRTPCAAAMAIGGAAEMGFDIGKPRDSLCNPKE